MTTLEKGIPPLMKLSHVEAEAITAMFKLYDIHTTGRIPQRLAIKLLKELGFGPLAHGVTAPDMSLKEFLLFLDFHVPEPVNPLSGPLYTFLNTVGKPAPSLFNSSASVGDPVPNVITAKDIAEFMESIGRPPISVENANLLLSSMVDYDDCARTPAVRVEYFERDVTIFAKKNNLLKEFK